MSDLDVVYDFYILFFIFFFFQILFIMQKYVSCFKLNYDENEGPKSSFAQLTLCQSEISESTHLPKSIADLRSFIITDVKLSDGCEVYGKQNVSISDIHVFSTDESVRDIIWYEYIKRFTGNQLYIETIDTRLSMYDIVCYINEDPGICEISFEISEQSIIKKLANITIKKSVDDELDLFKLAHVLYEGFSCNNKELLSSKRKIEELQTKLDQEYELKKFKEEELETRDIKTKQMMIDLLNEKKKKIKSLRKKLDSYLGDANSDDDSKYINKYVTKSVTELNSPGKRRRINKEMSPLKRAEQARELFYNTRRAKIKKEENDDDRFEDFHFYGINYENAPEPKRNLEVEFKKEEEKKKNQEIKSESESDSKTKREADKVPSLEYKSLPSLPESNAQPSMTSDSEVETETEAESGSYEMSHTLSSTNATATAEYASDSQSSTEAETDIE